MAREFIIMVFSSINAFNSVYGKKFDATEIKQDQCSFHLNAVYAVEVDLKESSVNTDYKGMYGLKMYFGNSKSLDYVKSYIKSLGLHPKYKQRIFDDHSGIVLLFNSAEELTTVTVGLTTWM